MFGDAGLGVSMAWKGMSEHVLVQPVKPTSGLASWASDRLRGRRARGWPKLWSGCFSSPGWSRPRSVLSRPYLYRLPLFSDITDFLCSDIDDFCSGDITDFCSADDDFCSGDITDDFCLDDFSQAAGRTLVLAGGGGCSLLLLSGWPRLSVCSGFDDFCSGDIIDDLCSDIDDICSVVFCFTDFTVVGLQRVVQYVCADGAWSMIDGGPSCSAVSFSKATWRTVQEPPNVCKAQVRLIVCCCCFFWSLPYIPKQLSGNGGQRGKTQAQGEAIATWSRCWSSPSSPDQVSRGVCVSVVWWCIGQCRTSCQSGKRRRATAQLRVWYLVLKAQMVKAGRVRGGQIASGSYSRFYEGVVSGKQ